MRRAGVFVLAIAIAGCSDAGSGSSAPAPEAASPQKPLAELPDIDQARVLQHIRTLASDEFAGRRPGTQGETLTVKYVSDQFQAAGLEPGHPDGTWVQRVPLVGITGKPSAMTLTPSAGSGQAGRKTSLTYGDDMIAWTRHVTDRVSLDPSDMIFVGYGVEAPEFQWDPITAAGPTSTTRGLKRAPRRC
jgi:hypothetical protein